MDNSVKLTDRADWKNALGLSGTWFGLHCGAGFCTGAQVVLYYSQYGAWALLTPIIAGFFMALYAYHLWNFSRVFKTYTYRETYNKLFEPYDKIFATIHEICYFIILVMAMSGVLSGAASLFQELFGVNYVLGSLLISLIIFLLTIFGAKFLFRAASVLSIILIASLLVVNFTGIIKAGGRIAEVITNWETSVPFTKALWPAFVYAMFQSAVMCGTVSVADGLKTEKDARAAGILGFVLNGGIMWIVAIMLLGFYPGVVGQTLPILGVIQNDLNSPILMLPYNTALFLAFVTTGISLVFSIVARFERYGENIIPKIETRRKVLSIIVIAVCFAISLFGLLAIIGKGYSAIGYVAIPFIYLPTIIIGPMKIKKKLAAEKQ